MGTDEIDPAYRKAFREALVIVAIYTAALQGEVPVRRANRRE